LTNNNLQKYRWFSHQVSRISKKEEAAYIKGQDDAIEHYGTFFKESPEAKELYQEWLEGNGKK